MTDNDIDKKVAEKMAAHRREILTIDAQKTALKILGSPNLESDLEFYIETLNHYIREGRQQ